MTEAAANTAPLPGTAPAPRQLPAWGWLLSVTFFPYGIFIGLGFARLLTWPRSIFLTLLSGTTVIGFAQLMTWLEEHQVGETWHLVALYSGVATFAAWSYLIYHIGRTAGYWSPQVLRGWRRAAWILGPLLIGLCSLSFALVWATHSLQDPAGCLHKLWLQHQK